MNLKKTIFDEHWFKAKKSNEGPGFEIVEHGWEQHVLIDHQQNYVYRYPRNQNAHQKLADEVSVLNRLRLVSFNVAIPLIIDHNDDFTKYRYIPGDVLDEQLICSFGAKDFESIGKDLGIFLSILHSVEPAIIADKKSKQRTSLYEYYESRIKKAPEADYYKHAQTLLGTIKNNQTDEVVVHGDLHGLNMVINPITKNLAGVIDFSELEIGNRYQDFRKLFMTDPRLLEPALNAYAEQTNKILDKKVILAWAYLNEWANIAFFGNQQTHPTYLRAKKHLKLWGEL